MTGMGNSIRWRLLAAAALTLAVALITAGWGLAVLFERHVERRVVSELETDIRQLMAGLSVDAEGNPVFSQEPTDQRYAQTFSGKYWQAEVGDVVVRKSRSLWDEDLALPESLPGIGEMHQHRIAGPRGRPLMVVERRFSVERSGKKHAFCLAAAVDSSEVRAAVAGFRTDLAWALLFLGVLLLAAFSTAVHVGLEPLSRLRAALASLHAGDERRLEGQFPQELSPLVDDLNSVLEQRAKAAHYAKTRAADLAHGLKTPLTAIEVVADELRSKGEQALGSELSEYVESMQRTVERELALARSAVAVQPGKPVKLLPVVEGLVRSLRRLSNGKVIDWEVAIDPGLAVVADDAMLTEVMGNLLDNARKWAKSRVRVRARMAHGSVEIAVDDDGPGVAAGVREEILGRGKRLDESMPGTGFGLAIVSDMLEQVGGQIALEGASLGGLGVRVVLPGRG